MARRNSNSEGVEMSVVCRGCFKIGSACGSCKRCCDQLLRIIENKDAEINQYKLAVQSMATQIVHPKTTAEDIVNTQLKPNESA